MSVITWLEKLDRALYYLDELDNIFDELPNPKETLDWQEKVNRIRKVVRREINIQNKEIFRRYRAAQLLRGDRRGADSDKPDSTNGEKNLSD